MKKYYFILGLFVQFYAQGLFGQTTISGQFKEEKGMPLPYANVLLLQQTDSAFVAGFITTDSGYFQFEKVQPGNYLLQASAIGFQTWFSDGLEVLAAKSNLDLGVQLLAENTVELESVIVRGEKPLYQKEVDRTIVNVSNSVLSTGSNALQILERSPGLVIDRRNNQLSLNGKGGVTIMINGKVVRLPQSEVMAMLQGMSADNIEKLEILDAPPAEYDAEGNAGMINLVLKENTDNGTNGSLSATAGYGWAEKGAATVNLNHNSKNNQLSASYSFNHDKSFTSWFATSTQNMPAFGGEVSARFLNQTRPTQNSHNVNLGFDHALSNRFNMGGSVTYNRTGNKASIQSDAEYLKQPDSLLVMNSMVSNNAHWESLISGIYLESQLTDKDKLNAEVDYILYRNNSPTLVESKFSDAAGVEGTPEGGLFSHIIRGASQTNIQIGVVKADYEKEFSNLFSLKAGVKSTFSINKNSSSLESFEDGRWHEEAGVDTHIRMTENIWAGYTSLSFQPDPATQIMAGLRYEGTQRNISQQQGDTSSVQHNWFPSLLFSRKLTDATSVHFSYNKRITRPSYHDLASYVVYADPGSVFTGNPLLRSGISHNLSAGINFQGYSFSVSVSRDNLPIVYNQATSNPEKTLMYISPQNLDFQKNLTFQWGLPIKVADWWSMNYNLSAGWRQFKLAHTEEPVQKTYFNYNFNGSQNFNLPANFSLEVSGWYTSGFYNGSVKGDGFGALNAGVKREFKNNRGTLQLSVEDVLQTMKITTYFGKLTREVFSLDSQVDYEAESAKATIIKISYLKSFGTGAKNKTRHSGADEEKNRIRNN